MNTDINPGHILQTATAFWASKVLLCAVDLRVFTVLGDGAMSARQLGDQVGLHPRGATDFLDALVALQFLRRDGDGEQGRYRYSPETALFLDKTKPSYVGGLVEMLNSRLYESWGSLGLALTTGKPQTAAARSGKPVFEALYADPAGLNQFLEAMSAVQAGNFMALAEKFDFTRYKTMADVGGALALLCRTVARRHPHLKLQSFDLPMVAPLAQKQVDAAGLQDRVTIVGGDFFADALPKADVITMGNILHDWGLDQKKALIRKVFEALPPGGAFIAIENIIDDGRRQNVFGLLMSLNMLLETESGFDYTGADFRRWCSEIGFQRVEILPLVGPASAAIAYK
jgi:hypothetical protein